MSTHQARGLVESWTPRARSAARQPIPSHRPVVGFVSGKGGVGKSAIAVNLATAAARSGARVLMIDGDIGVANADLLMGLAPRFDLDDWVRGDCDFEDLTCEGPHGLKLVVAGESPRAGALLRAALRGEAADGLGAWVSRFDLTLLDLGAGVDARVLDFAECCAPVLLIATPEPTSLADAYSVLKRLWDRAPTSEIELIVNRTRTGEEVDQTHRSLTRLAQRFLHRPIHLRGSLPEDAALLRSVAMQTPVVLGEEDSAVGRRLELLAESLLEECRSADGARSRATAPHRSPTHARADLPAVASAHFPARRRAGHRFPDPRA